LQQSSVVVNRKKSIYNESFPDPQLSGEASSSNIGLDEVEEGADVGVDTGKSGAL